MKSIRERIDWRICMHVRSRHQMIKPLPTVGMFNFRCHENATEYQRQHPECGIVEVIYIDNGDPILHYINHNPETGEYLETTLGYRAEHLEYYKIRDIHPDDYRRTPAEFSRSLDSWLYQFTNWFERFFFRIDRVL